MDMIHGVEINCKFQDTGVVVVNYDTLSNEDVQQTISYNK